MENVIENVPDWLDKMLLQKAVQSYKHDKNIQILCFKVSTSFAEHFASEMFQCEIELKNSESQLETLNVVIKAKPVNEGLKMDVVGQGPLFETEIKMYKETIPAINQLFEQNGLKVELGPELIYASETPFPYIILKDMTKDGFCASREPYDSIEDSMLLIKTLAHFHAASFVLSEIHKYDFSDYSYNNFQSENIVDNIFRESFKAFQEVLANWEGFEEFVPKIKLFADKIAQVGIQSYMPNKSGHGYNVLNHGDFHPRNILVKNNQENRLESFRFIDYQLSCFCSPAVDMAYLFGIVKMDENGEIPKERLVTFYYGEFIQALKLLGYSESPPTLLDLNLELLKHGKLNVILSICFIPFGFIDETTNVEDLFAAHTEKSKQIRMKLFEHPVCKSLIQKELRSWLHKGWLDV